MFESIICRSQDNLRIDNPIDIGLLFETMLFYSSTKLFGNNGVLEYVTKTISPHILLELLAEGLVEINYVESHGLIRNEPSGPNRVAYRPDYFTIGGQHPFHQQLRNACVESVGNDHKGRRLANKIETHIKYLRHEKTILDGTTQSILMPDYLKSSVKYIVSELAPTYALSGIEFHSSKSSNGIEISTNLDLDAVNAAHKLAAPHDPNLITVPGILAAVYDAHVVCIETMVRNRYNTHWRKTDI